MSQSIPYTLPDEPHPSALSYLSVNPLFPFFAIMFGGAFLSWGWFIINGVAIGSPTRKKEWLLAGVGLMGNGILFLTILYLTNEKILGKWGFQYSLIILLGWKLGITYAIYLLQRRTFHLYEYFGGRIQNGLIPLILLFFPLKKGSPFINPLIKFILF